MRATTDEPAPGGTPLVPLLLALGLELGRRGRHAEAVQALRKALAEPEEKSVDTITRALLGQLLAADDRGGALRTGLELAATAPAAVVPALVQLTPVLRASLLQPVADQLTGVEWGALLADGEVGVPARRGLLTFLGRALLVLDEPHRATAVLEAHREIVDDDAGLLLLLADARLRLWQPGPAEEVLAQADRVAATPADELQVTLRLARLYEQLGRSAELLARVRDVPAAEPAVAAELHALRALALLHLGDPDGAREVAETASATAPTSAAAAVAAACVHLAGHDYGRAKDSADTGLARHPQHKALAFLRFQAILEAGEELDRIDRRLSRFLRKLDPAEIDLYVNRSVRTRPADDPAVHYFRGMLAQAMARPDTALAALDRAAGLLGDRPAPESRLVSALVHRLRAQLLEPDDPAAAAAAYTTAGLLAFDHESYELSVALLTRAGELHELDQPSRWTLAEALFFLSFASAEPYGVAEDKIRQALRTWQEAFARGLPEFDLIWAYVSRARINVQLARITPDPYPLLVEALRFCECFAVCSLGTEPYFLVFGSACRLLGLYGLLTDVLAEAVGPPAQRGIEPLPIEQLVIAAANGGDLDRMRATLPAQRYLLKGTGWHADQARYHVLSNDPAAALEQLDALTPGDGSPMYHLWLRVMADWQLGDRAALEADAVRCAEAAVPEAEDWPGLAGWMWLLSGDARRAMALFAGLAGTDSWLTDPAVEVALCRLADHEPDDGKAEGEVRRFIAGTASYEDVLTMDAMLGVLATRFGDPPGGAFTRLRREAEARLAAGGWPLGPSGDLDRLTALAAERAGESRADATVVARAVRARLAVRNRAWSDAISGYRGLIRDLAAFPEVEAALAVVAGELGQLADTAPDEVAAHTGELADALAELRRAGSRRISPHPPELLLGDIHFILGDPARAGGLYRTAADLGGTAETNAYARIRLHVLSVLDGCPDADDQLAQAVRLCRDAGLLPAATICQVGLAMIAEPVEWQRLVDAWEPSAASPEDLVLTGRHSLAALYHSAGRLAEAEQEYRAVAAARAAALGPDHPDTLTTRHELGRVLQARGDWAEAQAEHRAVTEARQRVLGDLDAATLSARAELAWVLYRGDDWARAEQEYRSVLAGYGDDPDALTIRRELGQTLVAREDYAAARAEFRAAADGLEGRLGPGDPAAVQARVQEAVTFRLAGDPATAASRLAPLLARQDELLGSEHPDTLATRHQLGLALAQQGDLAGAAAAFAAVAEAGERVLGPGDPATVTSRRELATVLLNSEDFAAAVEEYRAVAAALSETAGAQAPATLTARRDVAFALFRQGDYAAAEAEYRALVHSMRAALGDDDRQTIGVRHDWAVLLRLVGDEAESVAELHAVLAENTARDGEDDPNTLATRRELAISLDAGGDGPGAEAEHRAVLAAWLRTAGAEAPATLGARFDLAVFLASAGRTGAAEGEFRTLAGTAARVLGEHHPETLAARWELAALLAARGDWAGAEAEYRRVAEGRAAGHDPAEPVAHLQLGVVLRQAGRFDEALAELGTAADTLPTAVERLTARFEIGVARAAMDEPAAAVAELRAVVSGLAGELGPEAEGTASARIELARVLGTRHEWAAAEAEYRLAARARAQASGPDDPKTLYAEYYLAGAVAAQDRWDEAVAGYRAVLERELRVFGEHHPNPRTTRNDLIDALIEQGDLEAAEAECRRGIAALDEGDPALPPVRQRLAFVLREAGALDAAEPEYRAALAGLERELGPDDRNTLTTRHQLAGLLYQVDDLAAAEVEFRAVFAALARTLGTDHPWTLATRMDVGTVLHARGDPAAAVAELRAAADGQRRALGEDDPGTQETLRRLALALRDLGRPDEAEEQLRSVLASMSRTLGAADPATLRQRADLAHLLAEEGHQAAAEAEYRTLAGTWDRVAGPEHPKALAQRYNLGLALAEQRRWAEALTEYRTVLEREIRTQGPQDPSTLMTHHQLGVALHGTGDAEAAAAELRAVVSARAAVLGADAEETLLSRLELARALASQGRSEAAVAEYRTVLEAQLRTRGADDPGTRGTGEELADLLAAVERYADAEAESGDSVPLDVSPPRESSDE
ncbi:tetratricopeptide repeat protein [Amycolatopsis sp. NPDC004625]|uniref:tetratricopeptide repeat protein n=1 Tax=Amycolatopsis sp. NPDC004625 TaxID=3154670 RepID=UPI0033AC889E